MGQVDGVKAVAWLALAAAAHGGQLTALIVDGRNNHAWKQTTPALKKAIEQSGRLRVDVATAPERNEDMAAFRPEFSKFDVVVLNYTDFGNGGDWSEETRDALTRYVRGGGGLVVVHAASSAFPRWKEFNEMIGLGGWGGRNEQSGPYLVYRAGAVVRETAAGAGGHHGKQHAYAVMVRERGHPITRGLPETWMHASDELFDHLRGPALRLTVLATAYSDTAAGGSGEHEPALFVVRSGRGRVFHTILGHSAEAMACAGFMTTLERGAEWAATGKVTTPVPRDFPTEREVRIRK